MSWGGGWGGPWGLGLPLSITFTAPSGIIGTYGPDLPWGVLEALTMTLGRQAQLLIGRPMTRIRQDFGPTDTTLRVETTLAFPDSGQIWIDDRLFVYTSKTASTFEGLATADGLERVNSSGIKTEVTIHLPSVAPE